MAAIDQDFPKSIHYAAINCATSGDNTLVAAVTGKIIRVMAMHLMSDADVLVRLESGAGGTAMTGIMSLEDTNGRFITLPFSQVGWCQTAASALLNLELSGAEDVDGLLAYALIGN